MEENSLDANHLDANDLELLSARLHQLDESIPLPRSLSAESLRHLLDEEDAKAAGEKPREKVLRPAFGQWKRWAATAAVFAVALAAWWGATGGTAGVAGIDGMTRSAPRGAVASSTAQEQAEDNGAGQQETAMLDGRSVGVDLASLSAKSYDQVVQTALDNNKLAVANRLPGVQIPEDELGGKGGGGDEADTGGNVTTAPALRSAFAQESASVTNVQSRGVDEGDIVKTDGQYLYYYRPANYQAAQNAVYVVDTKDLEVVSTIRVSANSGTELLVKDDTLALVVQDQAGEAGSLYDPGVLTSVDGAAVRTNSLPLTPADGVTTALLYDISNPQQPEEIRRVTQDGTYLASRLAGDTLYLLTTKTVVASSLGGAMPLCQAVPVIKDSLSQGAQAVAARDIVLAPMGYTTSYAVVTALDLDGGTPAQTKAVLGGGSQVYMTPQNLYFAYDSFEPGDDQTFTGLLRIDLSGGGLEVAAQGRIRGSLRGPFALDEQDNLLRVATTTTSYRTSTSSGAVFVLDQGLGQVGALEDLAPGQSISAVRFMGDLVCLTVSRQADPLMTVDLSDPAAPRLSGQVSLEGDPAYLHPLGTGYLVAMGKNTQQDAGGSVTAAGVRLGLYDLTDPASPKEIYTYNIAGTSTTSAALTDYKAFLDMPEKKVIGFPLVVREQTGGADPKLVSWGYGLFTVDPQAGFAFRGTVSHTDQLDDAYIVKNFLSVERGVVVGDTLYTFSNAKILASDLDTLQTTNQLSLL